jgi:hypothetical protein
VTLLIGGELLPRNTEEPTFVVVGGAPLPVNGAGLLSPAAGMPASSNSWQNTTEGNSQKAAIARPVFMFRFVVIFLNYAQPNALYPFKASVNALRF